MNFENKLKIGIGIYTTSEIAKILRIPYSKISTWMNEYWDGKLGKEFQNTYSWKVDNSRAVSFHTLVEFYMFALFAEAGVLAKDVLQAHIELSKLFNTPFPFARKDIIENIKTDGRKIYLEFAAKEILSLDGKKQFQIEFVKMFFKNLEFNEELLASRFYPLGRKNKIVVDPTRQFGHPVIADTNIFPETIYGMYKAGEPKKFIAFTYELSEKEVESAIEYCTAA